ncbi:MAG: peptidoglycan DD-metalloendopeptidase family protein [Candidatus Paceibacterota bacterium]|jgi:murein DD-endopeptidase MepM/ murein hydrolase activator NlpD
MKKSFKTKFNIFLRKEPNRASEGVLIPAGTKIEGLETVKGESVEDIDNWYKNENGLYFWAGGVEEITSESPSFIWPVESIYKKITTPFSEKWILNLKKKHTGVDIAVPVGKEVYVVADCVVRKIGWLDQKKTMAQYVTVEHDSSGYCSAYLHIDPAVKKDDKLKAKDIVGHTAQLIDMGSHLHFNFWKGTYNDLLCRGALPSLEFAGTIHPVSDPAFPSNFVDPMSVLYLD